MAGILTKGSDVLFRGQLKSAMKKLSSGVTERIDVNHEIHFTDGLGNDLPFSIVTIARGISGPNTTEFYEIFSRIINNNAYEYEFCFIKSSGPQYSIRAGVFSSVFNVGKIRRYFFNDLQDFNKLSHYVFTYDGSKSSNGIKLIRDKIDLTTLDGSGGTYTGMSQHSGHCNIARTNGDVTFARGNGGRALQCGVLVFNKVLTQNEIEFLYNHENQRIPDTAKPNLVLWYDFNEKPTNSITVKDKNGNYDGSINSLSGFFRANPYTEVAI